MAKRVVVVVLTGMLSPVLLMRLGFSLSGNPYDGVDLVEVLAIGLFYLAVFWYMTAPWAQRIYPGLHSRDRFTVLGLLLFIVVVASLFPQSYVLSTEQIADAPPFTPEWANVPASTVYGFPAGMYYRFSVETACCGMSTCMPGGMVLNLLGLAFAQRVILLLLVYVRMSLSAKKQMFRLRF